MNTNSQKSTMLSYVDNVFIELGQAPLLENKYFVQDWSAPPILHMKLNKSGGLYLLFLLNDDYLEIILDRMPETYQWSVDDITRDPDSFKKKLKELLICRIYIKHVGSNITKGTLFDKAGNPVQTFSFTRNIPLSFKTTEKLYDPIFPIKE